MELQLIWLNIFVAVNIIDHSTGMLLDHLQGVGIESTGLQWIFTFLKQRFQSVIEGGEKSRGFPIEGATIFNIAIDYSGLEPPAHIHHSLVI